MKLTRFLQIDLNAARAFMAQCALWLVEALQFLGAHENVLRPTLISMTCDLKIAFVQCAMAQLVFIDRRGHGGSSPGKDIDRNTRAITRALSGAVLGGLNSGPLRVRIARLQNLLDDSERVIARIAARMCRKLARLKPPRLVTVFARVIGQACAPAHFARAAADTS